MSYEEGREIGERLQPCVGALRAGRTFFLGSLAKNPLNTCFTLLTAEFCGYFHIKCFFFYIFFNFSLPRFSWRTTRQRTKRWGRGSRRAWLRWSRTPRLPSRTFSRSSQTRGLQWGEAQNRPLTPPTPELASGAPRNLPGLGLLVGWVLGLKPGVLCVPGELVPVLFITCDWFFFWKMTKNATWVRYPLPFNAVFSPAAGGWVGFLGSHVIVPGEWVSPCFFC